MALLLGLAASASPADDAWKDRLRKEGPDGWRRLREQFSKLDSQYSEIFLIPDKNQRARVEYQREVDLCYNGRMSRGRLFKPRPDSSPAEAFGPPFEAFHVVRDGEYGFWAEHFMSEPLKVTEVHPGLGPKDEQPLPSVLKAMYAIEYETLPDLLKDRHFVIQSATLFAEGKQRRLRVEFRYNREGSRHGRFESGQFVLAPDRDWALQRYRIKQAGSEGSREQIVEYGEPIGAFQPLKKITFHWLDKNDKVLDLPRRTTEFTRYLKREIPADFFTYSALGL